MPIFHPDVNGVAVPRKRIVIERTGDILHVRFPATNGEEPDRAVTRPIQAARKRCMEYLESQSAQIHRWSVGEDPPTNGGTWDDIRSRLREKNRSPLDLEIALPGNWTVEELGRQFGVLPATEASQPNAGAEAFSSQPDFEGIVSTLRAYRNVVIEGVAGTGKSHLIQSLKKEFGGERVWVMVFHPATSYEDFVEGLRPQGNDFVPRDGLFLDLCRRAARSPDMWVLVIDEINRANTAKVLGDLLYAIESSKRVVADKADAILSAEESEPDGEADIPSTVLQLERRGKNTGRTFRQRFVVPDNLLILGTMNTTDRSVGTLDLALRRRFVVLRMQPMDPSSLKNELRKRHEGNRAAVELDMDIDEWFRLNQKLGTSIGPDALLGHSYFFDFAAARARSVAAEGLNAWRDLLLPQLGEIFVAFNAVDRIDELLGDLETGGWTLRQIGSKVDGYPIVVERKE